MKHLKIEVEGMSCGGCVKKITNHFEGNEEISSTSVSLEGQSVEIMGTDKLSNMKIRNEILDLGFNVKSIKKL